jgi:hypothetical protein
MYNLSRNLSELPFSRRLHYETYVHSTSHASLHFLKIQKLDLSSSLSSSDFIYSKAICLQIFHDPLNIDSRVMHCSVRLCVGTLWASNYRPGEWAEGNVQERFQLILPSHTSHQPFTTSVYAHGRREIQFCFNQILRTYRNNFLRQ